MWCVDAGFSARCLYWLGHCDANFYRPNFISAKFCWFCINYFFCLRFNELRALRPCLMFHLVFIGHKTNGYIFALAVRIESSINLNCYWLDKIASKPNSIPYCSPPSDSSILLRSGSGGKISHATASNNCQPQILRYEKSGRVSNGFILANQLDLMRVWSGIELVGAKDWTGYFSRWNTIPHAARSFMMRSTFFYCVFTTC